MLRLVGISLIILTTLSLSAQDATFILSGKVSDLQTGATLPGAHIIVYPQNVGTATDKFGNFTIRLRRKKNMVVSITYVGYKRVEYPVLLKSQSDTLEVEIQLSLSSEKLPPVNITARSHPDTVYGSFSFCVADFEFYQDKFLLLTYASKDQKQNSLMLQDKHGKILLTALVPGEAESLYKDYEDRLYVICKETVFLIKIEAALLLLMPMSIDYFETNVRPGIDMIGEKIIFSNYSWNHPEFSYYTVWKHDTMIEELTTVVDKELMRMYRFEYYFLNNEARVAAWRLADQYEGVDKHDIAVIMTGFQNTTYYEQLYAPLFVVDDTLLLFDHYADMIYRYDARNRLLDSVEINYHKTRGPMKWKKELVKDQGNDEIYAVFQKNGYYYLNFVDVKKGKLDGAFKMSDKYAENMKIKDDYVYYVYDPQDKYQTPFLYKERIQL